MHNAMQYVELKLVASTVGFTVSQKRKKLWLG